MNKKDIPTELQNRLDEFHVEVPEIQAKSKLERLANWVYAPAKNPMNLLGIKGNSITGLILLPLIFVLVLSCTPILL